MLLMIDNFDSFTFNLVHYFRALGQEVEVFRNNEISINEISALAPEYIVISPGPCDPDAAGISLEVINHFIGKVPILGVCLGHQCIAQQLGANVVKAKRVMHGKTSLIKHNNKGLFTNLPNPLQVTRYHSLIVDKHTIPKALDVCAWTEDEHGNIDEIMAFEHQNFALASVQFHPESVLTEQGHQLLQNFITQYQKVKI